MSYSLIYDKQFVSLGDGRFIPMTIIGDSSMTTNDGGREKTVRNWGSFNIYDMPYASTLDQMMEAIYNRRSELLDSYPDYNDASYGYFTGLSISGNSTGNTSFGMLKGLFSSGIKKALTVEQLASNWVGFSVQTYISSTNEDRISKLGISPLNRGFISTADLKSFMDNEADKYVKAGIHLIFTFNLDAYDLRELRSIRQQFFPTVKKSTKSNLNGNYWVIEIEGNGYYKKGGSSKISVTYVKELAKRYATEQSAKSRSLSLSSLYSNNFKAVEVKSNQLEFT